MARKKHKKPFLHRLHAWWLKYEYKHTSLALLFIVLFILLLDSTLIATLFGAVEGWGFVGAFLAGVLSVSFFTAVPALVLIVDMADQLDPFGLAVVAGAGAMVGDWLLLIFFQDRITDELKPFMRRLGIKRFGKNLRRRYTRWLLFVVGAFAIMTPAPDEVGITLLGISRFRRVYMLAVCFALDTVGFLALVGLVRLLS